MDESQIAEIIENGEPIPGWLYQDEKAFMLTGWAGNRSRPGKSGYDPLDTYFELAHIEGVIIWWAITGKFIIRNPVYLILMTMVGFVYSLPLFGIFAFFQNPKDFGSLWVFLYCSPYWMVGFTILTNVILSCLSFFKTSRKDVL